VITAPSKDSFNDIDSPDTVHIECLPVSRDSSGRLVVELPSHSVSVLTVGE
jgi:alpha-L-arabinofuranosidase